MQSLGKYNNSRPLTVDQQFLFGLASALADDGADDTTLPYADDAAGFIHHCIFIDDAQGESDAGVMPFHLWPSQMELLMTIILNPLVLLLKARQLGITWMVCAYGLWMCLVKRSRLVLIFSIGQDEANEMMRRISSMYWRIPEQVRTQYPTVIKDNTEGMAWSNGSRIESLPSRKTSGSSYTASMVILDEFAKNPNASDVYASVKPTIDGGGKMIILSSAHGIGNLFHDLVMRAIDGFGRFVFMFLPWHARPGRDQAWYDSVAADAIDMTIMHQEYPATPDEAFEASEVDAFLPDIGLWDACVDPDLPPLGRHERCVMAIDAGESNDCFVWAIMSYHPDPKQKGVVAVRECMVYTPVPGEPLNFDNIEIDVRDALLRHAVLRMIYDRMLMGQFIRRLTLPSTTLQRRDERGQPIGAPRTFSKVTVPLEVFSQAGDRLEADKNLHDLIMSRRIVHNGRLSTLRQHIANANRKIDRDGRMRIVKRAPHLKIDAAVTISMVSARADEVLATPTRSNGFVAPRITGARRRGAA